jgi:hypothetical protein
LAPKAVAGKAKKKRVMSSNVSCSTVGRLLFEDFVVYVVLAEESVGGWRVPAMLPNSRPGEHIFFMVWMDRGFTPPRNQISSGISEEFLSYFHLGLTT